MSEERYTLQKFYALPGEVLTDLIDQYSLEQFVCGFMELGVLKTNSDYTHVWVALHEKHGAGMGFDEWWTQVVQPITDKHPAFEFNGMVISDYNRHGVAAFKGDISEYDAERLKWCADRRGHWTVRVYLERSDAT